MGVTVLVAVAVPVAVAVEGAVEVAVPVAVAVAAAAMQLKSSKAAPASTPPLMATDTPPISNVKLAVPGNDATLTSALFTKRTTEFGAPV